MKNFLALILIFAIQKTFSQGLPPVPKAGSYTTEAPVGLTPSKSANDDIFDDNIYDKHVLESQPEFPGGNDAFKLFVKENYKNTDPASPKGKYMHLL